MTKIGITDLADAALDTSWRKWVIAGKPAVLVTKNVKKLLLENPNLLNQNVIVHATITGYAGTYLEPNVPAYEELFEVLGALKDSQKKRIVIRIDPIVPIKAFVDQSLIVLKEARRLGYNRIRVSILDVYPHVLKRFEPYDIFHFDIKNIYNWDMAHSLTGEHKPYMSHAPLTIREHIIEQFKPCEVCGEPGIRCRGCISSIDLKILGVDDTPRLPEKRQRQFCTCLENKHELLRLGECAHGCLYCFNPRSS
jgi:DNA repair photolyase